MRQENVAKQSVADQILAEYNFDTNKSKNKLLHHKSGLAKLMAIENLHVVHSPSASTASFDLVNRVVTLPVLKEMHGYVYDAFIAHEIAHALYTEPDPKVLEKMLGDVPFHYMNVTEDARIEKLIQRKYPGTLRDFRKFYTDLASERRDFFGVHKRLEQGAKLEDFPFLDRVNLHFKIGTVMTIPFLNAEEKDLVHRTGQTETFQEAVDMAREIYEYCKQTNQDEQTIANPHEQPSEGEEGEDENGQGSSNKRRKQRVVTASEEQIRELIERAKQQQAEQQEADGDDSDKEGEESSDGSGNEDGDSISVGIVDPDGQSDQEQSDQNDGSSQEDQQPDIIIIPAGSTQDNFDNSMENMIFVTDAENRLSFGDVADASEWYDEDVIEIKQIKSNIANYFSGKKFEKTKAEGEYAKFLQQITPTINMMVAQFNMRKSALDYQATLESKTGQLDMNRISEYSICDDIFLRNELAPDAKNHNMFMLIDWSSSMSSDIANTVKQLIILMEFCHKVHIPFEVYGFTCGDRWSSSVGDVKDNEIFADGQANVFQFFTSSMKLREFREHCAHVLFMCENSKQSSIHSMGMTPMNHAIFICEYLLKKFQSRYNNQKTIFALLTDGGPNDGMIEGPRTAGRSIIMRDRDTYKNYEFDTYEPYWHNLLHYIKDRCHIDKMIGFYLTDRFDSYREGNNLCPKVDIDESASESHFKEHKYVELPASIAFDKYYVVSVSNFMIDKKNHMEKVNSATSKNAMQRALEKELNKNIKAMIFMRKFIEQIS